MKSASSRRAFLKHAALVGAASAAVPLIGQTPAAKPASAPRPEVKITDVRAYVVDRAILVEVVSDAGISGWGECAFDGGVLMKTFVDQLLKKEIVGRSPFDVRKLWDWMFFENHDLGPGGALPNAIAGVDLALWDLKGRLLNQPVYNLLGGRYRDRIAAYGSVPVRRGRVSVEDCVKSCVNFVQQGFKCIKVRMQIREHYLNPDPDPTFAYVAAVRKAIGDDIAFMVDANNGYSAQRAIATGRKLFEKWNVAYFEDPVSDQNLAEMAQVTAALQDQDIVAGEKCYTRWQIKDLMVIGNVDIVNPDVVKVGGITEMDRMATLSACFHKPIQMHNTRPTLSTAASLHCMASTPLVARFIEYPEVGTTFEGLMRLFHNRVKLQDGWLHVPEGPGLGLDVDTRAVRASAKPV
ncbi:MAG: mandelate racemase/muconate lactonizing enzyme family protein [Opitutaceae bacterium]|nr:mandelate racemase/muconate lactonizing enzyme family protein [Opitutaceae bacterium]